MPFASKGQVSQDYVDGAIEITEAQYSAAVDGMIAGLEVSIEGGFQIIPPAEPEPEPESELTPDQVLARAQAQRDGYLAMAALRIAPLQDAVDLGRATAVESANLKKWKEYRVDVNRVSEQTGFPTDITWPVSPEQPAEQEKYIG